MSCNLILDRLVKVSWQAWPIFGPQQLWPVQANYCRPNVSAFPCQALPVLTLASRGLSRPCRPFMLFAFLSQFWPWPTAARPGRAGPVAAASPVFFIPWPTWPKPGHKPGSPRPSGWALTPVYPSLAGFLMQGKCCVVTDGAADIVVVPLGFFTWLVYICTYRRIPVISPGLIQFRKGFWVGL